MRGLRAMISTARLRLRELEAGDAAFILELLTDPSWIRYIGDKGIRTLDGAQRYIDDGPRQMYRRLGFGLYLVELLATGEPTGICGLIRRDALEDVDLGFAFLPRFRGHGYAIEAASAVMCHARDVLAIPRLVAIVTADNERSTRLLVRLGFAFERTIRLSKDGEELALYGADVSAKVPRGAGA